MTGPIPDCFERLRTSNARLIEAQRRISELERELALAREALCQTANELAKALIALDARNEAKP